MHQSIDILLFAGARDAVGSDRVSIDCPETVDVAAIKRLLIANFPELGSVVPFSRVAVGNAFVDEHTSLELASIDEPIAIIPPVSGG
jgi:molybdopterin converting factor small subunit